MRLAFASAVASALIGFACAAVPLSTMAAPQAPAAAPKMQDAVDAPSAQAFVSNFKAPKAAETAGTPDGLTAATAMVQAAGLSCTPTEGRIIGTSTSGKTTYKAVEAACKDSLGVIMVQANADKPTSADCLSVRSEFADKVNPLMCTLASNASATAGLQSYLTRAHSDCAPTNAAFLGEGTATVGYELVCAGGTGEILQVNLPMSATSPVVAFSCFAYAQQKPEGSPWPCRLSQEAVNTAAIKALAAKANPPCTPTKQRFVGALSDGTENIEFACQDGKGIVVQASARGNVIRAIPCIQAGAMCTLTKVDMVAAAQDMTGKAKAAGLTSCDVAKFQSLKLQNGITEATEVACKAGPGGVLITKDDKTMYFDCGRSQAEGYACSLNGKEAANDAMTAQLKAQGKSSCVVNGTRAMASASSAYIEVSCSDGAPGYLIKFPRTANTPADPFDVYTCATAKQVGGGCSLPTNKVG
jgi:hypothetical protein